MWTGHDRPLSPAVTLTVVAHPLPLFRAGIIAACEQIPECDPVVGAASLAEIATAIAPAGVAGSPPEPCLCLCSTDLDEANLTGLAALAARRPHMRVMVMLAAATTRVDVAAALGWGVMAIVEPGITADDLAGAIRSSLSGRVTLAPGVAMEDAGDAGTPIDLTRRERQVLDLMGRGLGNRAIAAELFISENTVRNHVRRVHEKLDARTRTEAVVRAARAGLLEISQPTG